MYVYTYTYIYIYIYIHTRIPVLSHAEIPRAAWLCFLVQGLVGHSHCRCRSRDMIRGSGTSSRCAS